MRKSFSLGILLTFLLAFTPLQAIQAEPMLGEVKLFAGNFAPRNWALAQGQLLNIRQNSALYSILGNTYGGDGRTTFALPDLRKQVLHTNGFMNYIICIIGQYPSRN